MNNLPITIFHIDTADGPKDVVSCLPGELIFGRGPNSAGLPSEAIMGVLSPLWKPGGPITPAVFIRNRAFVEFLHGVIARFAPRGPDLIAEARRQGDGWVYIIDQRTPTPEGTVPPEDIVGAFEVRGGLLGTYHPCTEHRILADSGFFDLGAELEESLQKELAAIGS